MSSIITPSAPSPPFYIGKGFIDYSGNKLMIFGYPLPNYLSRDFSSYIPGWPYIMDATTNFDVSTITEDQEVVALLWKGSATSGKTLYVDIKYYRKHDNKLVFWHQDSHLTHYDCEVAYPAWIGWLSEDVFKQFGGYYEEIMENGYYYIDFSITGSDNASQRINFVVRGMPPFLRTPYIADTTVNWKIGLSSTFDINSYKRVGICTQSFANGQSSAPNGILSSVNAPSSSIACTTTGKITELRPGTSYTFYGFAQAANGLYYNCGSKTITTTGIPRPNKFSWDTSKSSGQQFNVTATEWNRLIQNVKDVHIYKKGYYDSYSYPMTTVSRGQQFYAQRFNEVRFAIGSLNTTGIGTKYKGDTIYASELNTLVTKLNQIQ